MAAIKLHETSGAIREAVGDTKDRVRRIKIIQAGPGSSAYYPAEVLERDGAIAFPAGTPWRTKSYANHPTMEENWIQPERDVTKIVGKQVSEVEWDEESQALYADYQFSKKFYDEVVSEFDDALGMSIYAMGQPILDEYGDPAIKTIGQYTGTVLERLLQDPMNSVDVVTVAGAGGAIMPRLTEAMKPFVETPAAEPQRSHKKENTVEKKEIEELFNESLSKFADTFVAKLTEALKPAPVDPETPNIAAVAEAVAKSELPELARAEVYKAIESGTKPEDAIAAQKEYVSKLEEGIRARLAESKDDLYGATAGGNAETFQLRGYAGVSN